MKKEFLQNPIIDGRYADPEARFYCGKYWIYATSSMEFDLQKNLTAFSSDDGINWTKHENIVDMNDFPWVKRAVWAPTIIKHNNLYYLIFSSNDIHSKNEKGGLEIAVSKLPSGPFKGILDKPLIGDIINNSQPIDAHLFKDDDGTIYLYYGGWGHCNVAILNNNMDGLVPFKNGNSILEISPLNYVEGPCMIKKDGLYYFFWSTGQWNEDNYSVLYGISHSPIGPFEYKGVVLKTDKNVAYSPGHNGYIYLSDSNSYYIVYHRREINEKDPNARCLCIDKMIIKDGFVLPVKMTSKTYAKLI